MFILVMKAPRRDILRLIAGKLDYTPQRQSEWLDRGRKPHSAGGAIQDPNSCRRCRRSATRTSAPALPCPPRAAQPPARRPGAEGRVPSAARLAGSPPGRPCPLLAVADGDRTACSCTAASRPAPSSSTGSQRLTSTHRCLVGQQDHEFSMCSAFRYRHRTAPSRTAAGPRIHAQDAAQPPCARPPAGPHSTLNPQRSMKCR
jgi:hypothetical protein